METMKLQRLKSCVVFGDTMFIVFLLISGHSKCYSICKEKFNKAIEFDCFTSLNERKIAKKEQNNCGLQTEQANLQFMTQDDNANIALEMPMIFQLVVWLDFFYFSHVDEIFSELSVTRWSPEEYQHQLMYVYQK